MQNCQGRLRNAHEPWEKGPDFFNAAGERTPQEFAGERRRMGATTRRMKGRDRRLDACSCAWSRTPQWGLLRLRKSPYEELSSCEDKTPKRSLS